MKHLRDFADPYRVTDGSKFRLKDHDPAETNGIDHKEDAAKDLQHSIEMLSDLQEKLYAANDWALLVIVQAMDAAGKDSTIKHVLSGVNPQGCQVYSFKAPSDEELDHDFLWRTNRCLPERGRIGIFNRSDYEEVLVVKVHQEFLARQRIPGELVTKKIWQERCEDINAMERYLTRNGVAICKFFLHVSKEEQKKRFLSRLNEPDKNWKFSPADVQERGLWDEYPSAYEEAIRATATGYAPWHVVPADHKWFTRLVVASAIVEKLRSLKLRFPSVDKKKQKELAEIRKTLERGK
jgi:PPK2 family polyphosphate:nucleotide phosphotransferase